MLEALEHLRGRGFGGDMYVTPSAMVRCSACHHETAPADLLLHLLIRLEGVSDPGDEAAVLGLECGVCGMRGAAVVRYGPEAGPQDVAVLRAVEDHRS